MEGLNLCQVAHPYLCHWHTPVLQYMSTHLYTAAAETVLADSSSCFAGSASNWLTP